jgi:hypothetical protein
MRRFLRPLPSNDIHDPVDTNRILLEEVNALDQHRQDEVAEKLAILWRCFADEFGSPADFHNQPRIRQDAYIAKFERVATRSTAVRHSANGHLHYSVALMWQFLLITRDGVRQPSALSLSNKVAALVDHAHDRAVRARRSHFVDALSASLLAPTSVSPEGMADHSLEFQAETREFEAGRDGEKTPSHTAGGSSRQRSRETYRREGERWMRRRRVPSARRNLH